MARGRTRKGQVVLVFWKRWEEGIGHLPYTAAYRTNEPEETDEYRAEPFCGTFRQAYEHAETLNRGFGR
jgi:hypothetical protein